jgi:hypothetical protein
MRNGSTRSNDMVWVSTHVDVDLDEFDDDEIKEEYYKRGLGGEAETWDEEEELTKAWVAHHNGERDKAYEILWKMCLIKLNKVV